jgi:glycosyltransferase involved in cell wall biosynthesis
MNTSPLVGVVVPAYNSARWITATLESLQTQTLTEWTCVVVDDGSTDDTAQIVRKIAAVDERILVVQQSNRGLPSARNTGLAALPDCRYVAFLDADDLYRPRALELLVRTLEKRADAVGAYGLAEYVDESGATIGAGLHPARQRWRREIAGHRLALQDPKADASFRTIVVGSPIWPPAVALQRTEQVRAVGGFDPSFPMAEDWEFYLRITRRGPYAAVDEHVAQYRRQGTNMTSRHDEMMYHLDRARRAAWESCENSADQRRFLLRAWRLLEGRQVLVLGRHTLRSLRRRRWRSAGEATVGAVICAALVLRPSPPPANRRRPRWTRPDDHLNIPL